MDTCLPSLNWEASAAPEIRSVETLGEGDFCVCYLINRTHVLRLAKHAEGSASLRRENRLLPLLKDHLDVEIPRIEEAGTRTGTGEQFVFYPLVPGVALEPEVLSSLDERCRSSLVGQMAGFAARLHSFPVELAASCGLKEIDPRRYLPEMIGRAGDLISHLMTADVWRYYKRLLELYLDTPELHSYRRALLHGDLSPGHLLADLEGCALTGVIDFGDSIIGDPHRDLIYLLEDYGKDTLDLFLTFYSPDAKRQATTRVQVFQQMNNVEYCISKLSEGGDTLEEALDTLAAQATTEPLV